MSIRTTAGATDLLSAPRSRVLFRRRAAVLLLNLLTIAALFAAMTGAMAAEGVTLLEGAMLAAFAVTLPWLSIGFWNAVIGTILAARGGQDETLALTDGGRTAVVTRTAIVMAVRNEDAAAAISRLDAIDADIRAAGYANHFDIHLLSDTDDPQIAAQEERMMAAWAARDGRIHYRRRTDNTGYKAGNLQEFCHRAVDDYDFFLPLDADSFMSAAAIVRLVRIAQANPRIGILQTLVVGTPSSAFFTRAFQFGMRHGMRAYTTGAAWWTGDCGPYWGHNALIRMRPFAQFCELPVLPGTGPLGGPIMSHDQVEAVLMRRAGYDVRVLVEEGESYEENPPSLPDFIRRELRWCQGNMQYFWLLGLPGLKVMSRVQLALAILMYLGAPAWMAFIAFGATQAMIGGGFAHSWGIALFVAVLSMTFAPKIMGLVGVVASREAARYGGRLRVLAGGLAELVVSMLTAPVVAFAVALFAGGLLFGRKLDWRAQPRGVRAVAWDEALISFWPQTLFGVVLAAILWAFVPAVLPWAAPVLAALLLAVPFATLSSSAPLGRASVAAGLCDIPEDRNPPAVLARLRKPEESFGGDPRPILLASPAKV